MELRTQVENLVNAIAGGGMRSSAALGRKLAEVEDELTRLEAAPATPAVVPLVTNIKARAKAIIKSLPILLEADPEKARAALRDAGQKLTSAAR